MRGSKNAGCQLTDSGMQHISKERMDHEEHFRSLLLNKVALIKTPLLTLIPVICHRAEFSYKRLIDAHLLNHVTPH